MEPVDAVMTFILAVVFIATVFEYNWFWSSFRARYIDIFRLLPDLPVIHRHYLVLLYAVYFRMLQVLKVIFFSCAMVIVFCNAEDCFLHAIRFCL